MTAEARTATAASREGTRLPRTFAALRHQNFRLFFIGQLISLIGTWMQNTAQGWLVVLLASPGAALGQKTAGEAEALASLYLGLISIANSLPILFGSLYGGVIADRYSKRTIMVLTQAAQGILAVGLAALVAYGHVQVWHIVLFALLLGVTNVFDVPARQAFVVEMVGKEDLPNAIGLNSATFNAARAFGPAVAGILLAALHGKSEEQALAQCFLLNGLSYIAVIVGLLLMRGDFSPKGTSPGSPLEATREVFAYLRERRPTLVLIVMVASFSIFATPYFILMPSLARFTLETDARQFGWLMSCQGLGAMAGALMVATLSDYPRKGRLLSAAALSFPALLLALTICRNLTLACMLMVLLGFTLISFLANANSLMQTSTPDHLRGRVMGLYAVMMMGLAPIGSLWAGAVAKLAGAPTAIAVGAVVMLLGAGFVIIRYPHFRRTGQTLPETL
jgi:MFS family permease